jgi:hypothetical protein
MLMLSTVVNQFVGNEMLANIGVADNSLEEVQT